MRELQWTRFDERKPTDESKALAVEWKDGQMTTYNPGWTRRISCRVTEEEYAMYRDYCHNTDRHHVAELIDHALKWALRQDKRNVPEKYHGLLEKRS